MHVSVDTLSVQPQGSSGLQYANGLNQKKKFQMNSTNLSHHVPNGNPGIQDLAATKIQTAFRAYRVSLSGGYIKCYYTF